MTGASREVFRRVGGPEPRLQCHSEGIGSARPPRRRTCGSGRRTSSSDTAESRGEARREKRDERTKASRPRKRIPQNEPPASEPRPSATLHGRGGDAPRRRAGRNSGNFGVTDSGAVGGVDSGNPGVTNTGSDGVVRRPRRNRYRDPRDETAEMPGLRRTKDGVATDEGRGYAGRKDAGASAEEVETPRNETGSNGRNAISGHLRRGIMVL